MISFIEGVLEYLDDTYIIINNNGIGYRINVPASVIKKSPIVGDKLKIHTYLNVREDALTLYGFLTTEELELYKKLILVNGIGPKCALAMLSTYNSTDLIIAIGTEDLKSLCEIPGIGKKTAQRLVLDLKDKFDISSISNTQISDLSVCTNNIVSEAIEALITLGYSKNDAQTVISKITEYNSTEDLVKKSLRNLISN